MSNILILTSGCHKEEIPCSSPQKQGSTWSTEGSMVKLVGMLDLKSAHRSNIPGIEILVEGRGLAIF